MKKILLVHPLEWFGDVARTVVERNPGIVVTPNFEQILAMVKEGTVERICIMFSTFTEVAPEAVRKIHLINPNIPIMVWNSEEPETKSPNELYRDTSSYNLCLEIDGFFQREGG